jgi:hypothetical protein
MKAFTGRFKVSIRAKIRK